MNKAEATLSRERDDRSDDCCSKAAKGKTEKKRWLFSSPIERLPLAVTVSVVFALFLCSDCHKTS